MGKPVGAATVTARQRETLRNVKTSKFAERRAQSRREKGTAKRAWGRAGLNRNPWGGKTRTCCLSESLKHVRRSRSNAPGSAKRPIEGKPGFEATVSHKIKITPLLCRPALPSLAHDFRPAANGCASGRCVWLSWMTPVGTQGTNAAAARGFRYGFGGAPQNQGFTHRPWREHHHLPTLWVGFVSQHVTYPHFR